jgi:glutamate-1-semialdehyde 2,1-aminomutase
MASGQDVRAPDVASDATLRARAARVLPWSDGLYGHMGVRGLPAGFPQFHERGDGPLVWDVDGNEYVDLMCSWGPMVLGHHHPIVDEAARDQARRGDALNGPTAAMVELAELLAATADGAAWSMFTKNGTDATTVSVMIARAATQRRYVLAAQGAYHGSAPWCTPRPDGTIFEDRAALEYFEFNDLTTVRAAIARCDADIAAIIVSPFKHDAGFDQELVDQRFASGLRELCDRVGAVLIIDDVRAGFRLDLRGSWAPLGVEPDLTARGKAMGNGHAISAVTGVEALREAATRIYATGSYWYGAVAMAAAAATIKVLRDDDGIEKMHAAGRQLRAGMARQAATHRLAIRQTGPVQMPYLTFRGDVDRQRLSLFAQEALRGGVFLHPAHNWFLSTAHDEAVIDRVLDATDRAFAAVAQQLGPNVEGSAVAR